MNYVGEAETGSWTILAPTDELLDVLDHQSGPVSPLLSDILLNAEVSTTARTEMAMPAPAPMPMPMPMPNEPISDVSPLQKLLQYHILPGRLLASNIKDGMLLGTELRTSALRGGRQRLRVDVSERLDRNKWDDFGQGEVRFGGATVLGKPGWPWIIPNRRTLMHYS